MRPGSHRRKGVSFAVQNPSFGPVHANTPRSIGAGMQVSLVTLRVEEVRMPGGDAWEQHVDEVRARMLGEAPIADPVASPLPHESVYRMAQMADQVFDHIVRVPAVRIADWEARVIYDVQLTGEGDRLRACGFSMTVADEGDVEGRDLLTRSEAILIAKRFARGELPLHDIDRGRSGRPTRYRRPDLARVAAVYREAEAARGRRDPGEPQVSVRRYVQRAFDAASLQTVDGWIRAARDAGLLPPARTGKPRSGEHGGAPRA